MAEDQQFCLRWNNFQAYITSQFESLRDDEDFVDVTLACGGQRLGAHKVVLSACSPFFKELFKTNPCPHPIIFMRDVEVEHVVSLLEFMYAGEVNVAQTSLSGFLRTAESLQIRGLTDATKPAAPVEPSLTDDKTRVTSTREEPDEDRAGTCSETINPFAVAQQQAVVAAELDFVEPKLELPDYNSEEDDDEGVSRDAHYMMDVDGRMPTLDCKAGTSAPTLDGFAHISVPAAARVGGAQEVPPTGNNGNTSRTLHSLDPRPCNMCGRVYSNLSNLRQHVRLIHNPQQVACPVCRKQFKSTLYLKRHLATYRHQRPPDHIKDQLEHDNTTTTVAPQFIIPAATPT